MAQVRYMFSWVDNYNPIFLFLGPNLSNLTWGGNVVCQVAEVVMLTPHLHHPAYHSTNSHQQIPICINNGSEVFQEKTRSQVAILEFAPFILGTVIFKQRAKTNGIGGK